jgi:hypothetical protein
MANGIPKKRAKAEQLRKKRVQAASTLPPAHYPKRLAAVGSEPRQARFDIVQSGAQTCPEEAL